MNSALGQITKCCKCVRARSALVLCLLAAACAGEQPRRDLPPSASDLVLLKSVKLCDRKAAFLQARQALPLQREAWGSGEEARVPSSRSESGTEESYFFDEDGQLVGVLFAFPTGLDLKPYPVLRQTLSQLKPAFEFYLSAVQLPSRENLDASSLYETGDEKTTMRYITLGAQARPILFLASVAIDPYASLLSPFRQEFLARIGPAEQAKGGKRAGVQGSVDKEPFPSLQQFARGQTAHLAYCGSRNYDIAAQAYARAIEHGFTDKAWLAEAHHKLGLALEGKGFLERAKAAMQQSLAVRPNSPEVLNNLGIVYAKLGERNKAVEAFEKSVTLRPNYPMARFNLGEAYESVNPKLAISEYETYLALVEGIPEEAERAARARERVKALSR